MGSGQDVGIAGFVIQGGGNTRVVIRALGPSLEVFGIAQPLADPALVLKNSSGLTLGENDDWSAAQAAEIQAAGLAPAREAEAALVVTLPAGAYTVLVSGRTGGGVGLVEVYDLEPQNTARLVNISTRGRVESGNEVMIGGFVIGGNIPRKVIVRALGPSLEAFGVQGALRDPTIRLFAGPTLSAENDNWRSGQASEILLSGFPPTGDQESAIVAVLPPGSYTAIVSGFADATGVGLVEIYEIP